MCVSPSLLFLPFLWLSCGCVVSSSVPDLIPAERNARVEARHAQIIPKLICPCCCSQELPSSRYSGTAPQGPPRCLPIRGGGPCQRTHVADDANIVLAWTLKHLVTVQLLFGLQSEFCSILLISVNMFDCQILDQILRLRQFNAIMNCR